MKQPDFKSFTDPVHGFVAVPKGVMMALVESPEVQRLRRIRQLGVGHMVFPGAEHSRFGHALGAMAVMQKALATLRAKGADIAPDEVTAALGAALLHDIGHGPFSHTLEHTLLGGFSHEMMSRRLIVRLAERIGPPVDAALAIFDDEYPARFLHELVSSQLDMDRLDYLRRDTYYTGVVEGAVGVERIVRNLRLHPLDVTGEIAVDRKGLHAVENFLMARRLMYWQVYLHKAVVAGDQLMRSILRRARDLLQRGDTRPMCGSPTLLFFLENRLTASDLDTAEIVDRYVELDDADILYSFKRWATTDDAILSDLSRRFLTRRFPRATFVQDEPSDHDLDRLKDAVATAAVLPSSDGEDLPRYYLAIDRADHAAYETRAETIKIVDPDGIKHELSAIADAATVSALTRFESRWYVCIPKEVDATTVLLAS